MTKIIIILSLLFASCSHTLKKGESCKSFCEEKGMTCKKALMSGPILDPSTGNYQEGPTYWFCRKTEIYRVEAK